MTRRTEYRPLSEIAPAKRNVKKHDLAEIIQSIKRFGFADAVIVDERTGKLVSGHGRVEALQAMMKEADSVNNTPAGIIADDSSGPQRRWLVPVQTGWASKDDTEAEAFLVAANRIGERGGYDLVVLEAVLKDLAAADALAGTGYNDEELQELIDGAAAGGTVTYSRKIEAPVYTPKGEKPPIASLVDTTKTRQLLAEIAAADLPPEVAEFLRLAAERHTSFQFRKIAEYYCHAAPAVQRLFERSALVIIDFDKAIEGGFVRMTERLGVLADTEGWADDEP